MVNAEATDYFTIVKLPTQKRCLSDCPAPLAEVSWRAWILHVLCLCLCSSHPLAVPTKGHRLSPEALLAVFAYPG